MDEGPLAKSKVSVDEGIFHVVNIKKRMLKKAHSHLIASQRHESHTKQMQHTARALEILNNALDQKSFGAKRKNAIPKSDYMKRSRNDSGESNSGEGIWKRLMSSNSGASICKRLMSVGVGFTLEPPFIEARRKAVHTQLTKERKTTAADILTTETMYKMLDLYDKEFFSSCLLSTLTSMKCSLTICIDDTCAVCPENLRSTTAYCFPTTDNKTQIIHMLTHIFMDLERRREAVFKEHIYIGRNNRCGDILECIMLTFEHELVHAIVGFFCPSMAYLTNSELDNMLIKNAPITPLYVPDGDKKHLMNLQNDPHFASVWKDWKENAAHKGDVNASDRHSVIFMGILVNLFRHGGYRTYLGNAKKEENPFIMRYIPELRRAIRDWD